MALKAIVDSLDTIPETLKTEYVEKEGKFYLDVESVEGFALEDVTGLKNTLSLVNTKVSATEKELKKFGSSWDDAAKKWTHTIDPVKAKTAISKYDEFTAFDPAKEADKIAEAKVKSIQEQLLAGFETEKGVLVEDNASLLSTVNDLMIKQTATMELVAAKGDPDLLMPHIERMTRVTRKDGKFLVEVLDKDGNVRIGDNKGLPMTIAQLVEEMKKSPSYGKAFEGEGKGGSGKLPNQNGGGSPNGLKRSQMSPAQKAEYQEKYGAQEFLKLPLK